MSEERLVTTERIDGIGLIVIDSPPVNALSQLVRAGLLDSLADLRADPAIAAIVITGSKHHFIAGADVREFSGPLKEPSLPSVIQAIEACEKPVVAAISGLALGGGLEVALACHARLASNGSKLGFPEVKLGIIPGAEGVVRLVRLVDASTAVDMVAGGRACTAEQALRLGLIDKVTTVPDLRNHAIAHARLLSQRSPQRISELPVSHYDAVGFEVACNGWLGKARGQESVVAAVQAVRDSVLLPFATAAVANREAFRRLRQSPQAEALRHLFFAEREAQRAPGLDKTRAKPISTVAVIGAGLMGRGIATACIRADIRTVLIDPAKDVLREAPLAIERSLRRWAKAEQIDESIVAKSLSQLTTITELSAISKADLVIEAVFEDVSVKRQVIAQADCLARHDALLATNTSYLDINALSAVCDNPGRLIGLHFFAPAEVMRLVEVIRGDHSQPDAVATGITFAKALSKIPVISGVCDGFIVNRILASYRQEMEYVLEDGSLPEGVDKALEDFGMAMGPFAVADLSGLDIAWSRRKRLGSQRRAGERYVKVADQLCELGRLGRKTGAGWYRYEDGIRKNDPIVEDLIVQASRERGLPRRAVTDKEIVYRAITAMTKEAHKILDERVALRSSDIDLAVVNGLGFPAWRGGPLFYEAHSATM